MRILRDGQEVDPQVFGIERPLQKGKRLGDFATHWPERDAVMETQMQYDDRISMMAFLPARRAKPCRNWWPLVGWLLVAAVGVSAWTWFIWWLTR